MSEIRDLSVFLESYKLDAYIDKLIEKEYTIENLHILTASDLDKLRITNKKDRACLLGAVNLLKDEHCLPVQERMKRRENRLEAARPFKRNVGPEERRRQRALEQASRAGETLEATSGVSIITLADGTVEINTAEAPREMPAFSATVPTANEAARQATIFLCHHRVDRPWPKPSSKLSQTLHLANASPPSYAPLYTIHQHGETSVVEPPLKVSQGYQARFCPTCCDYVNESMQGAWQFQVIEKVLVGEDQYEDVAVWKPFTQTESMKIEYAHKRAEPTVKIRKTMVDFDANQWGTKPIRRVESDAVAFPTLKKGDLTPVPKRQIEPQRALAANIQDLHRTLISETEENRSRLFISQQQDKGLLQVLLEIAGIMDEFHFQQRKAVEEEEAEARAKFEGPEFDAALDKLYEFEEQSVRDVALRKWEKESAKILKQQCGLLEDMEAVARQDVENEEASFRKNLDKLVRLFNDTIRDHLDRIRKKAQRNQKNAEGQPRCPVCRKTDCEFFNHPWRAAFGKHPEGKRLTNTPDETLSTLANRANEKEYSEYMLNVKAKRRDSKARKKLLAHLSNNTWGSPPPPLHAKLDDTAATHATNLSGVGLGVGDVSGLAGGSSPIPGRVVNESLSTPQKVPPLAMAAAVAGGGGGGGGGGTSISSSAGAGCGGGTAPAGSSDGPEQHPPRPHSSASVGPTATAAGRSMSRPASATPFRNAVGPGYSVTADTVNKLSKRAPSPAKGR